MLDWLERVGRVLRGLRGVPWTLTWLYVRRPRLYRVPRRQRRNWALCLSKYSFFWLTEFWPEILAYKSLNWQISVRVWVCSTDTSTSPAPLESDWFTHAVVELGFRFRLFLAQFFLFDLISRYLSTMGNEVYLMISTLTIEPNHFFRVQRWRLESVEWV